MAKATILSDVQNVLGCINGSDPLEVRQVDWPESALNPMVAAGAAVWGWAEVPSGEAGSEPAPETGGEPAAETAVGVLTETSGTEAADADLATVATADSGTDTTVAAPRRARTSTTG